MIFVGAVFGVRIGIHMIIRSKQFGMVILLKQFIIKVHIRLKRLLCCPRFVFMASNRWQTLFLWLTSTPSRLCICLPTNLFQLSFSFFRFLFIVPFSFDLPSSETPFYFLNLQISFLVEIKSLWFYNLRDYFFKFIY